VPDTPLGRVLADAVPSPPRALDVTQVLVRARRRVRLQNAAVGLSAVLGAVAVATAVVASQPAPGRRQPDVAAATPTSTVPPSSPTATATATDPSPSPPTAPNVVGQDIARALAVMDRAGICARVGSIINATGRVGTIASQRTTDLDCQVVLAVSAGPRTNAPTCSALAVSAGQGGAAAGNAGFPITFRNSSNQACSLSGYPTVLATDSSTGRTVTARHTPSGYLGGTDLPLPTYVLAPGDRVSVLVEGTDNPVGNASTCSTLNDIRVIVDHQSVRTRQVLQNCTGMQVHRYVPGLTGYAPQRYYQIPS